MYGTATDPTTPTATSTTPTASASATLYTNSWGCAVMATVLL